ncbi:MFS transporter [Runella aurantiaca]|uniref:MFS transporter n=1 Tax=Runella aurantiaca TaxID=2282308 RepID=A0A369I8E6_9BACT|nr:MFS transporter [Runella aurantiaca]RDB02946.1 MFS transporter [Runella aurantiaca]
MTNTQTRKAGIPQGIITVLVSILPVMAVITLMPVVPTLRNHFKDVPYIETLAPFVISAPGLCVALFGPYAGFLADKIGRRKLLIIFSILYAIGGVLPFFIESFSALIAGRLILGIGEAFILTISNILLGDYFEQSKRNTWLMIQNIVGPLVGFFVITGSGQLASLGWQYPFLLYAITLIIPIGAYFFIFEPTEKAPSIANNKDIFFQFSKKALIKVFLTTFFASVLYYVYTLHFSLALDKIGISDPKEVGKITAVASLMLPLGAVLFKLLGTKSNRIQFGLMFTLIGIGLIGVGLATDLTSVMASAVIQQVGCGMAIPVLIAFGLRSVPTEYRGRGMGIWSSGFFLGLSVSPFVVGFVRNLTGDILKAFLVFGVICLVMVVVNFIFDKE